MSHRTSTIALLLSVAAAIVVALIHSAAPLAGRNAELYKASSPDDKVTLAYVATTHAVLAGIALQLGYYRQEGLEVRADPETENVKSTWRTME
jgi:ABC-type nitrate/sulfonate/bicarbonate transport system substrate-binding protein